MINQIKGLHHVTSLASKARPNNAFFTNTLGLRRIKQTVNFDAPDVYHLYYGDEEGTPGSVMTYFPFPAAARGRPGTGEVGRTSFSVPKGTLNAWSARLTSHGTTGLGTDTCFGDNRHLYDGPDVVGASADLLAYMCFEEIDRHDNVIRFAVPDGNEANVIDIETIKGANHASQGAGSVHHIAFAVENRARQLEVREALIDTGYAVTPVINRDYFWAIYFRTPGGVLFEVATNEPGFATDEDTANLGEVLQLPSQHAHLREKLARTLEPLS